MMATATDNCDGVMGPRHLLRAFTPHILPADRMLSLWGSGVGGVKGMQECKRSLYPTLTISDDVPDC